jgi:roadblock/LC7 domain-containing protein
MPSRSDKMSVNSSRAVFEKSGNAQRAPAQAPLADVRARLAEFAQEQIAPHVNDNVSLLASNTSISTSQMVYGDVFGRSKDSAKMSDLTREEIQAQIAASEARGDTRVVRLEGKIDTLTATIIGKLDAANEKMSADHEYNRTTRWVMVGLAIAIGGLMVGMATYGDAMFGRGMSVRDVVQTVLKENAIQSAPKPPK